MKRAKVAAGRTARSLLSAPSPDPDDGHSEDGQADRGHGQADLGPRGLLYRLLAQAPHVVRRADPLRETVDGLRQVLPGALDRKSVV